MMTYTIEEIRSLIELAQEKDLELLEVEGISIRPRREVVEFVQEKERKLTAEELEEEEEEMLFYSTGGRA